MSPIAPALAAQSAAIADLTAELGRRVDAASLRITDREGDLPLAPPGRRSPNGACRTLRTADGWIALNLARAEDRDLIPAWLGCDFGGEAWDLVEANASNHASAALIEGATLLGLPAGAAGEVRFESLDAPLIRMAAGGARGPRTLKVVDLSAMWAGPMCGAVLAAMGAQVTKVESSRRSDPTRSATPDFFRRLNGEKAHLALDLADPTGQAQLRDAIVAADVLVTGARPRAFASLGLDSADLFAQNPRLVWVAVTGYGWTGEAAARVGFGDDTAVAGGIVGWVAGEPHFLGDALADPVTGLAAAAGALRAVIQGGGVLVDVALARSAAGAAHACGLRQAA